MADPEALSGLRGLYQDLCALTEARLQNVDRLHHELELCIADFKRLLEKPPKGDASRNALNSDTITLDGNQYKINEDFRQGVLEVADALDLDELHAARLFLTAQEDAERLARAPSFSAITQFHEQRLYLLECVKVILRESLNDDENAEERKDWMLALVTEILGIGNPAAINASAYVRKCIRSMGEIERQIRYLGERLQKISLVGSTSSQDALDIIHFQQKILTRQHETLGSIVCYLFKGRHASSDDFKTLLDSLRILDRFDLILVHYLPPLTAAIVQHGSTESGNLRDARSLDRKITSPPESESWNLHSFHAATTVLWLSEYSGWYSDNDANLASEGMNLEEEGERRSTLFMTALADGAFQFLLAVCSAVTPQDWLDPARHELVSLLLADANGLTLETDDYSDSLRILLMEHLETFAESCIANMPDTVRRLKVEEDRLRLDLLESRERIQMSSLQGIKEAPMHLEGFLVIIAFAYEHRPEAAEEFWTDPDGNLFGFLHWASKRQTVPRVSAFCEMLCAVSEGEGCANSAHRFLLEEGHMPAKKLKRSTSMSWAQIFAELQLYSSRLGERILANPQTPYEMSEPESPLMLACYLRLTAHMCRESSSARDWLLTHPTFDLRYTLLVLNSARIPANLRASIFTALEALMTQRTLITGEDMWSRVDLAYSGTLELDSKKLSQVAGTHLWSGRHFLDEASGSFEEATSFVSLLRSITTAPSDSTSLNDVLPFPETLGSTYRMPGIEPYVDVVLGQIFAKKLGGRKAAELNASKYHIWMLRWKCLDFILTCLSTFNESLVWIANQSSDFSIDSSMRASSLLAYVQLHPFSRTMEWLFNEEVAEALFAASHQDVIEISGADSSSIQVVALLKSVEVMNLILDLQATFIDVVRPLIKKQPPGRRTAVATSSIASFEDLVSSHLRIVYDLSSYCTTGHQDLTVASLSLLRKLSSSRKLNGSGASNLGLSLRPSTIIEMLEREANSDQIARRLVDELESDVRELENGPEAPGYLIKLSVFDFLNSCLAAIPDRPNIAHIFLGFSRLGNSLTAARVGRNVFDPDNPFVLGTSLFHTVLRLVQTYPLGTEDSLVSWMMRIKAAGLQVLKLLWSSPLSSPLIVGELRDNLFLSSQFVYQPLVGPKSLWDGFPIASEEFLATEASDALINFLEYRAMLLEYAITDLRFASREESSSIQARALSTLMGNSTDVTGETISHVNIFDLFDFADLDIARPMSEPEVTFLHGVDLSVCTTNDSPDFGKSYNIDLVRELVTLKKTELVNLRYIQPSSTEEERVLVEAEALLAFVAKVNQVYLIKAARVHTLQSWVELIIVVVEICQMDAKSKTTLILQTLQVVLPRLERAVFESLAEAAEMARLVTTLMKNLEAQTLIDTPGRAGEVINDRLFQLFRVCVRGICAPDTPVSLRDLFYTISSQFLSRMTYESLVATNIRRQSMQVIKSAGEHFIDLVCDDSFAGEEDSKTTALLLLNMMVGLAKQEDSTLVIDSLVRLNYLGMLVDSLKNVSLEVQDADPKDISSLLSNCNAQLSLLLQVAHTRLGATHIVNAGLFNAIRQSQLFAADPDIGIGEYLSKPETYVEDSKLLTGLDIDNPEALRQYYDLLLSVIRIIIATVSSRGTNNQQMLEHARQFLSENRYSMVGIFKRYASIGGVASQATRNDLGDLVKSYVALITIADFVDFEEDKAQTPGRRGFT